MESRRETKINSENVYLGTGFDYERGRAIYSFKVRPDLLKMIRTDPQVKEDFLCFVRDAMSVTIMDVDDELEGL